MTLLILSLLFLLLGGAFGFTLIYLQQLQTIAKTAPAVVLQPPEITDKSESQSPTSLSTVAVIIPVYNESDNVEACVQSVLNSCDWPSDRLGVWLVDDQSTDDTWERAIALQTRLADPRLHLIAGQPRPTEQPWMGKNWACHQGYQQATGEFLLFLDADVRLHPGAIASAIAAAAAQTSDLLSGALTVECGCWAEWLAQPLIFSFITVVVPFAAINDPTSESVFAAGPFMLFRRTAYDKIGGHAAVANQVVEDVELARRIKQAGLTMTYTVLKELGTLRMYPTGQALWEGWTKNWYMGSQCNLKVTLQGAVTVFWVCAMPTLLLLGLLLWGAIAGWSVPLFIGIAIALVTIGLHYPIRRAFQAIAGTPTRYWWLIGASGLYVTAIILASIIKTETGWGWTWRGRPLQRPTT